MKIEIHTDLAAAERIWRLHWPQKVLFDSWSLRACFQRAFDRPPCFITASRNGTLMGLLALSWIEESGCFGQFPGETWRGKTWLEQNRIIAVNREAASAVFENVPGAVYLRYLVPEAVSVVSPGAVETDEVGYLFYPGRYDYNFSRYLAELPGKFRKKLRGELNRLCGGCKPVFRFNRMEDLDHLLEMNLTGFRDRSYFSDPRFTQAFRNLTGWLHANGRLNITTVLLGETVAAVDLGIVWGDTYTLLAGGTNPDFPGVAKLINLHHLEWSCRQRIRTVDFLCGEFNWKPRFRLNPRPLYTVRRSKAAAAVPVSDIEIPWGLECLTA